MSVRTIGRLHGRSSAYLCLLIRCPKIKRRNLRGDEARKLCPNLQIVQVPTAHGKADLTAYRAAGKEVFEAAHPLQMCCLIMRYCCAHMSDADCNGIGVP